MPVVSHLAFSHTRISLQRLVAGADLARDADAHHGAPLRRGVCTAHRADLWML